MYALFSHLTKDKATKNKRHCVEISTNQIGHRFSSVFTDRVPLVFIFHCSISLQKKPTNQGHGFLKKETSLLKIAATLTINYIICRNA